MKSSTLLLVFFVFNFTSGYGQDQVDAQPAFPLLTKFDKVRDFTMNREGNEAYITIQSMTEDVSVITQLKKNEASWAPAIATFSGKYKDLEPFLTQDGLKLYFVSNRPMHDSINTPKDFDIWFVERENKESSWGEPKNLGKPVNTEHNEFYPSLSYNGNLYFTSDSPKAFGKDDIFISVYKNNRYSEPIRLDENINSEGFEYNSYVSSDESYLIFGGYQRPDGLGSGDLYISYKDELGNWSKAVALPPSINSGFMDYCPFVHEESNKIYFTSRRSASPSSRILSIDDLQHHLDSYENGNSRIYVAPFKHSKVN